MDFEEAWREAQMEESAKRQPAGRSLHAATSMRDTDPYDDEDAFSDEDLLRAIPFANDAAPAEALLPLLPTVQPLRIRGTHGVAAPEDQAVRTPDAQTHVVDRKPSFASSSPPPHSRPAPVSEAELRGVLAVPPLGRESFLLRGDDGRVRWVTIAEGAQTKGGWSRRSRAHRLAGHKRSHMEESARGMSASDELTAAVADPFLQRNSTSSSSSRASSTESRAGDEERSVAFERGGTRVQAMLHTIYEAEAKRQQQDARAAERRRAHERAARWDAEEEEGMSALDLVINDFSTPRRNTRPTSAAASTAPLPTAPASSNRRRSSNIKDGELWVTKYSPKLFREVLSDESINLRLLQWLKSWDAYVFPDEESSGLGSGGNTRTGGATKILGSSGNGKLDLGASLTGKDSSTATAAAAPPEERIAVLTGPPGVGKTTLVHVLAAHCGYEVIEVNASVERTASRLEALIKTAVSAAGPAPGGRYRRSTTAVPHPSPRANARRTANTSEAKDEHVAATTSLVQHLLRPKCLVIDEIDGIASSSVAAYLMQVQLHRPVFCLCNDLYVPSLRPLRMNCTHVYHLPAIRPQRLLSRLEEIARREEVTVLDHTALSELITTSGGDVRSCLNTMQFIGSVVRQRDEERERDRPLSDTSPSGQASARQTVTELIRRMQGKDARLALMECWQLLFTRPERNTAVQALRQEYGIDYDAMMEAAAAQRGAPHDLAEARRQRERARAIETPAAAADDSRRNGGGSAAVGHGRRDARLGMPASTPSVSTKEAVAYGFRVDPGYVFVAQRLLRLADKEGLIDGLQENYLHRAYTDYSFTRTSCTATAFSEQDVITTAAFQSPQTLMGAAARLAQVTALTVYAHCSTGARGGRLEYPREQATLRRLHAESLHITQQFRGGCRPALTMFLNGVEVTGTEVAPMLLRCLFDRALRFPAHAIASFARLPTADQQLLKAAVARHVVYGLTYAKDREQTSFTPFIPRTAAGPAAAPTAGVGSFFATRAEADEAPYRLSPELDRLLAGVVRPMEKALNGGLRRGIGGAALFSQRPSFKDRNAGAPSGNDNRSSDKGDNHGTPFPRSTGFAAAQIGTSSVPLGAVMMPMRNEIRQILVGEIRQSQILESMEALKRNQRPTVMRSASEGREIGERKRTRAGDGGDPPTTSASENAKTTDGVEGDLAVARDAQRLHTERDLPPRVSTPTNVKPDAEVAAEALPVPSTEVSAMKVGPSPPPEGKEGRGGVRRDFFGRPIPDSCASTYAAGAAGLKMIGKSSPPAQQATPSSPLATSPTTAGGSRRGAPRACVRYVYQDGSTNAVKMPAVLSDF